ncbi:hypothetical protein NAP1_08190 [Erythrobacter sp. NAP1]|uniref:hypothetical protein n=1 Tax=Erythrobacter sp. NAP1 TaxID=237727 RepID=UPI0000686F29|nr:hypothetical protein [Erythrobacter sp. NAP1]EAQ30744.1 hypothetical protein NAP1_08190 [Erythrobacter sp. NAP1]
MYSEDDINSAVAAGALSAEAAESFRAHMTRVRELPRGSEENFRLINSFNDIFVSIGIVILLLAVGAIGQALAAMFVPAEAWLETIPSRMSAAQLEARADARNLKTALDLCLPGLLVAVTAWPLAEFFTRKRRMALPSILLLLAFVGGVFFAVLGAGFTIILNGSDRIGAVIAALAAFAGAGAAYLHWRRFMVPITVAAGAAGVAGTVIALMLAAVGPGLITPDILLVLVFIAGLAVFGFAMRWDISDRERITRRSDVAFWLHLLAAPMIAHPIFALLGVTEGDNLGVGAAVGVLGVYIAFGLLALAIDRRALLVSALAYVLFALTFLFREFGAVELNFALTALVIGSALLSLSAFWQPIRRSVVAALPGNVQASLPATEDPALSMAASA